MRRNRHVDVAFLALLILLTVLARWHHRALPSQTVPGTLGVPESARHSDPPSTDELWHLALSTGRGPDAVRLPVGSVIYDTPAFTAIETARPWWTVWITLDHVVHPPLYVQTLRFWRAIFGGSDGIAIAYSIFWSCMATAFVYLAVRDASGRTAAVWAGAIFAVAPTQIYFGLDVRAYAMLTAECAALLLIVTRIDRRGATWGNCLALGGVLLATMLTHYLAAMTCVATGGVALHVARRGERRRIVIIGIAAAAVYAGVWLPFLLRQMRNVNDVANMFFGNAEGSVWDVVPRTLTMPLRLISEGWADHDVAVLVGSVLLIGPLALSYRYRELGVPAFMAVFGCFGLLATDVVQQTQMTNLIRYCAPCAPAIFAAVFGAFARLGTGGVRWPLHAAGVAAIVTGFVYRPHFPERDDSPALFAMAQAVAPHVRPGQTLIFCAPPRSPYQPWYGSLETGHVRGIHPRDVLLLRAPATDAAISALRGEDAWLMPLFEHADASQILPGAVVLQEIAYTPQPHRRMQTFRAYRVKLPPRPPAPSRG